MEGFDLSEEMQQLVRNNGDEVAIHTGDCILWKAEHPNCQGCQYELGCGKTVRLMAIMLIPDMYHPTDYADYQKMNERIGELAHKTLRAKTVEELHLVPSQ